MLAFHQNIQQKLFFQQKEILNKQDPAIQYTIEYDNGNKSLNFLDINITNTVNKKYEFKVRRKKAITNIHMKPTSLTLKPSKKCSRVSFTEYTRYVWSNISKKKKSF